MAVCFVHENTHTRLRVVPYATEQELEDVLAANPYLLTEDDEPELVCVDRQVSLPGAGIADLVFVDPAGQITVVEVKLGRNGQSRREVVGQVFDYVSTLADHTYHEVDEMTGGELDRALRSFAEAEGGTDYEVLRKACSTELRAGKVRVSVVTDDAPASLVRIMAFMNEHTDLDVRLIVVQKHERDGVAVFAPQPIVIARPEKVVGHRARGVVDADLAAVVAVFDGDSGLGLTTDPRSKAKSYRMVLIPGWPKALHYEFCVLPSGVTAEFHAEDPTLGSFVPVLNGLEASVGEALPGATVLVLTGWWKGLGGLRVSFPDEAPPEVVAAGMVTLIEATRDRLDGEVRARLAAAG